MEYDPSEVMEVCEKFQDGESRVMVVVGAEAKKLGMSRDDAGTLCRGLLWMFGASPKVGKDWEALTAHFSEGYEKG